MSILIIALTGCFEAILFSLHRANENAKAKLAAKPANRRAYPRKKGFYNV